MMKKNCHSSTVKRFSSIFVNAKIKICKKPNLYLSKGCALLLKKLFKEFSKGFANQENG
jgi:hypothetical protein